jgi:hypothetical protein
MIFNSFAMSRVSDVADLILDAYLNAKRSVPQEVVDKMQQMARADPNDDVRRTIRRFLREP